MASKREQLKKLRQSNLEKQKPIKEMTTPVEDKLEELEKYISKEETVEEEQKAEIIEELNIEELDAEKEEAAEKGVSEENQLERRGQQQPPEPEEELLKKKETTKRTSMALLVSNNKFVRLRSMQLGLSIQNYINLLIDEEVMRQKQNSAAETDIIENLDMNYRRGENSTIVALVLTETNAKFLKRGGAMLGMNATTFLNYIISEEQKREQQNGSRKGAFDD